MRNTMVEHTNIPIHTLKVSCSNCSLRELCLPVGLSREEMSQLDAVIRQSRRLKRGEYLFRAGEPFKSVFAVRTGFFKTCVGSHDGREQVTGLHLAGEALGLDGICDDTHPRTAVALEDSSVCVIPYSALKSLCSEAGSVQLRMHKLMSEQIVRETTQTMLLGSLNAEERVAAFLLDVSSRYLKRGYSPSEFNLRMTREDIGSYLGMTLETVSRTLSKFQKRGLIEMQGRHVQIVDFDGLQHL